MTPFRAIEDDETAGAIPLPPVTPTERRAEAAPARDERSPRPLPVKWLLVCFDVAAMLAGILAACFARSLMGGVTGPVVQFWFKASAIAVPLAVVVFVQLRLYSSRYITSGLDEMRRVVYGTASLTALIALASTALNQRSSRIWLALIFLTTTAAVGAERRMARAWFDRLRSRGELMRRVLIIGCNIEGLAIYRMFRQERSLGYESMGFIDDAIRGDVIIDGHRVPIVGTTDKTIDLAHRLQANGVIICATAMDLGNSNILIRSLTEAGLHVELSSTLQDIATSRLTVRRLGRFPVVYVEPAQRHGWRAGAKRTFDVLGASFGLLLLSPVLAIAAIAIRLDTPGPVFFRQVRVGRHGMRFRVLKLRTMVPNAEALIDDVKHLNETDGPLFKSKADPRVTRVGGLLRRLSIDEIPQLFNVLLGEMSLVGPRPALPREVDEWSTQLHQRLRVKPGITGMWQVHGRGSSEFEIYERLDLYYVDNWSLITDLVIIAQTIPKVLLRKGAY